MVELVIKNLKEVPEEFHGQIKSICEEKVEFFNQLFKRYDKDLTLEVIFDHSSSLYKVTGSLNLKSKKILVVEEGKDVLTVLSTLLSELKKAVKRQHELERKDYEYKRKR